MKYILKLYVIKETQNSINALRNLTKICHENLQDGQYEIIVIDLLKNPRLAEEDKILAVPTLVKLLPPPIQKVIGDLSDKEKVLLGLDLIKKQ